MTYTLPERGKNVLGQVLLDCSTEPMTGYFRDGCCRTDESDRGSHTVCCVVTAEFLAFSRSRGNDLSTPMPAYNFPGLKPGDSWCLCASRWLEAYQVGMAPLVRLESTHKAALRIVPLDYLLERAVGEAGVQ